MTDTEHTGSEQGTSENPVFVIYAPPFDINSGGAIFLHRLVHELRSLGEQAFLCPMRPPAPRGRRAMLMRLVPRALRPTPPVPVPFVTSPDFDTPVFEDDALPENAIALYTGWGFTAGPQPLMSGRFSSRQVISVTIPQ